MNAVRYDIVSGRPPTPMMADIMPERQPKAPCPSRSAPDSGDAIAPSAARRCGGRTSVAGAHAAPAAYDSVAVFRAALRCTRKCVGIRSKLAPLNASCNACSGTREANLVPIRAVTIDGSAMATAVARLTLSLATNRAAPVTVLHDKEHSEMPVAAS